MNELCINTQLLTRCRAWQEGKQERKVVKIPNQSFHAHERNMERWKCRDHACIAFVADQANRASFCNAKINAADSYVGIEKNISQHFAGRVRQRRNIFCIRNAQLFVEELT